MMSRFGFACFGRDPFDWRSHFGDAEHLPRSARLMPMNVSIVRWGWLWKTVRACIFRWGAAISSPHAAGPRWPAWQCCAGWRNAPPSVTVLQW